MIICDLKKCVGCGACSVSCPRQAIHMASGDHGFCIPQVDEKVCVKCGICIKRCPVNNEILKNNPLDIVAAWTKNQMNRFESTSGGIFSVLVSSVIDRGGYVVGTRWDSSFQTNSFLTNDRKEALSFRGSKYVQSVMGDIFSQTKSVLDTGKLVLFSGTPCQIHSLRLFLGETYPNLFTVDLVCHGVPSYAMFNRYLSEVSEKRGNKTIASVSLRRKKPCWDFSSVEISFSDGSLYKELTMNDPYFCLFNKGYSLRESCHFCKYASTSRVSDITLSDFWNYRPTSFKMRKYDKGVSCVFINSEKGTALFDSVSGELVFKRSTISQALRSNRSLQSPFPPLEDNGLFWKDYEGGMSVFDLKEKYLPGHFSIPLSFWTKRWIKEHAWFFFGKLNG